MKNVYIYDVLHGDSRHAVIQLVQTSPNRTFHRLDDTSCAGERLSATQGSRDDQGGEPEVRRGPLRHGTALGRVRPGRQAYWEWQRQRQRQSQPQRKPEREPWREQRQAAAEGPQLRAVAPVDVPRTLLPDAAPRRIRDGTRVHMECPRGEMGRFVPARFRIPVEPKAADGRGQGVPLVSDRRMGNSERRDAAAEPRRPNSSTDTDSDTERHRRRGMGRGSMGFFCP